MIERTLAVVRTQAVENRQVGHVRKHIEAAGFIIPTIMKVRPVDNEAETATIYRRIPYMVPHR